MGGCQFFPDLIPATHTQVPILQSLQSLHRQFGYGLFDLLGSFAYAEWREQAMTVMVYFFF